MKIYHNHNVKYNMNKNITMYIFHFKELLLPSCDLLEVYIYFEIFTFTGKYS